MLKSFRTALALGALSLSPLAALAQTSELFISEYLEGSNNNKAIELYNGTSVAVDLATNQYRLELHVNGAATASQSVALSGTLASGGVLVLCHSASNASILALCNVQNSTVINHNGDDLFVLRKNSPSIGNGTIVDSFGANTGDPGSNWGTGNYTTNNHTLRRKSDVCSGDTNISDAVDPSIEWDSFAQDTHDGLGSHTANCEFAPHEIVVSGPQFVSFDTLASSGTSNVMPTGFTFEETGGDGLYLADDGDNAINDGVYSFGSDSNSDRALGTWQAGATRGTSVTPYIGARLKNSTGDLIKYLYIRFQGEQWRRAAGDTTADRLNFQYSTNATSLTDGAATWVDFDALDFSSPVTTATVASLDGNASGNNAQVSAWIETLNLAADGHLWIRWLDDNSNPVSDALAIDDLLIGVPVIAIDSTKSVTEGSTGCSPSTQLSINVSRLISVPSTGIPFTYTTTPGTATQDVDYTGATDVAQTLLSGGTVSQVMIPITCDDVDEPDETFSIGIGTAAASGYFVLAANASGTATILDDDTGIVWPTISIGDVNDPEGNGGGTTTFTFPVTLSSAAPTGGVSFTVNTSDGSAVAPGDYAAVVAGSGSISEGSSSGSVTVNVVADGTFELPETFSVTLSAVSNVAVSGNDLTATGTIEDDDLVTYRIHEIQGAGAYSPIVLDPIPTDTTIVGGVQVRVENAIVTAVTQIFGVDGSPADQNGFFMQSADTDADANPLTSEGILVFTSTAPTVAVGDVVTVIGQAQERASQTQISTAVPGSSVVINGTSALPTAVEWSLTSGKPSRNPANLSCPGTGPGTGNNADTNFECFEGMLVTMPNATISAPNQRRASDLFAEAYASPTTVRSRREEGLLFGLSTEPGNAAAGVWDGNPEVIEIDYDEAGLATGTELTAGSRFSATGVVGYSFGDFEFYPTSYAPITTQAVPEPVITPVGGSELTVASFNTQHLCDDPNAPLPSDTDDPVGDDDGDANNNDGDSDCVRDTPVAGAGAFTYADKLRKVSSYIRIVLNNPDVIGLQEVDEQTTLEALAAQIIADGGPTYSAHLVEGNDPGGIDVGFLVNTARVSAVTIEQINEELNWYDPAVTCTLPDTYPCENLHDRPPLLLRATFNGTGGPYPFAVLNNHTKSFGNVDDSGPAAERDRAKRFQQAKDIATLVQQFQTATGPFNGLGTAGIPLVLVGDYNAFEYTDGHADVVGLISGQYDDAANECNATLSNGQGTETCNIGINVVDPPLYISTLAVPLRERVSYLFTQNFGVVQGASTRDLAAAQVIDHILLARSAQGFYLATDYGVANNAAAEQTNRQIPPPAPASVTPIRASDHDGVVVYLDFNCLVSPELNPDNDTVCGMLDNCPNIANDDQADMDDDGVGDVCDGDVDGDDVGNDDDNCPLDANEDQTDTDNDGVGNVCDLYPNDPETLFRDGFED